MTLSSVGKVVATTTLNTISTTNSGVTSSIKPLNSDSKFNDSKKNFEDYKNQISFNEKIIDANLKTKTLYEIDENIFKSSFSGIPKNTEKEKYFIDIKSNNDEGEITLKVIGRAHEFSETYQYFQTYTAILWEKKFSGFKKISTESIIKERSLGIVVKDLIFNSVIKGTAFIARKEKEKPIYYIATNSHVIADAIKQKKSFLGRKQNFLKKYHHIPETNLLSFFSFIQNNKRIQGIKNIRLVHDFATNDDLFIPKEKFIAADMALLKIEFFSNLNDPFKSWWEKRPTKTRKMNIGDFLNSSHNDDFNYSSEKGEQFRQLFYLGSYGSAIQDSEWKHCAKNNNSKSFDFKLHSGNSQNYWKKHKPFKWRGQKQHAKIGSIRSKNPSEATYAGSSGSAVYDKNLNVIGIHYAAAYPSLNTPCDAKQSDFQNYYQWFSLDKTAKDFFHLKNIPDAFNYYINKKWKPEHVEQIREKFFDYGKEIFGEKKQKPKNKKNIFFLKNTPKNFSTEYKKITDINLPFSKKRWSICKK